MPLHACIIYRAEQGYTGLSALQINVEGAVTVVKYIADSHDASGLNTGRQEVLYGTHNGVLGQLFLDHQTIKQGWQLRSDVHKGIEAYASRLHTASRCAILRRDKPTSAAYDPCMSPSGNRDIN